MILSDVFLGNQLASPENVKLWSSSGGWKPKRDHAFQASGFVLPCATRHACSMSAFVRTKRLCRKWSHEATRFQRILLLFRGTCPLAHSLYKFKRNAVQGIWYLVDIVCHIWDLFSFLWWHWWLQTWSYFLSFQSRKWVCDGRETLHETQGAGTNSAASRLREGVI